MDNLHICFSGCRCEGQGVAQASTKPVDWWDEECIRVSGEMICPECGKPYWRHESVAKEAPTLIRACDGRLLKI